MRWSNRHFDRPIHHMMVEHVEQVRLFSVHANDVRTFFCRVISSSLYGGGGGDSVVIQHIHETYHALDQGKRISPVMFKRLAMWWVGCISPFSYMRQSDHALLSIRLRAVIFPSCPVSISTYRTYDSI